MEKKRSLGIILFGIFYLLYSIFCFIAYFNIEEQPPVLVVVGFVCLVISLGIFRKDLTIYYFLLGYALIRIGFWVVTSFTYVIEFSFPLKEFLIDLFWVLFFGFNVFYFTRPKVKEQFK